MKKAVVLSLLLIGALALWFFGRPAYKHFKEMRFLKQARQFMSAGDYRNASLSASQVLELAPNNIEACRIKAELAEKINSPSALDWRRRIADLAPSAENKLGVASVALRLQGPPYPLAAQILDELSASATNRTDYHAVAAELALRLHNTKEAEYHFLECLRIEPTNELNQLNLAVLRLSSSNQVLAAEAHATLERLRSNTNVGDVALRWLVGESLSKNDFTAADDYSKELLASPKATTEDRLQRLTIQQRRNSPEFWPSLTALQKSALTNVVVICSLSAWLVAHGLADEDLAWLNGCPAKLRQEMPVPVALADCYIARKDWAGLESLLEAQKWGELDFLRLVFLCKSAKEQKKTLAADGHWRAAVREAGDRLGPLNALLGVAGSLGREKAREDLLWQIAVRYPKERWTLRELEQLYGESGNTPGLNRLAEKRASWDPLDFRAQNDFAATSMLLKRNLPKAFAAANEVYKLHPDDPVTASTYAYALHLQGKTREGLAVLVKLKPEALESPSLALYYGVLLSASGQTTKAATYLALAKGAKLLPEEKALLAETVEGLSK